MILINKSNILPAWVPPSDEQCKDNNKEGCNYTSNDNAEFDSKFLLHFGFYYSTGRWTVCFGGYG